MRFFAFVGLALVCGVSWGAKRSGKEMTLKTLTKNSDSVVLGKCKDQRVSWVGKSLETSYDIEVRESIKGKGFKAGDKFTVTVPGGELTTPPLTQFVELTPKMFVGEEVALFLKDKGEVPEYAKGRANEKSKVNQGPQVVGWYEGKFSVYQDKKDGQTKVTRLSPSAGNVIAGSRAVERMLRAVSAGDVTVTSGPVVELGDGIVTTPEGKELFDRALAAEQALNANPAPAAKKANTVNERQPQGLRAQGLDEFKAQVRKLAAEK